MDAILHRDAVRWRLLEVVANLELPDCWIATGFVRNAVWDALHGRTPQPPNGDVDVIWFDPDRCDEKLDRDMEDKLRVAVPSIDWSVKNQARMHSRNDDKSYQSSSDAMRYWPETATAVAARWVRGDELEIACPLGLDDLFNLLLRPTQRFAHEKLPIFEERVRSKAWIELWPLLKRAETGGG
ncbi:nucleotidyltransferase family protein [Qipengyuania sp. NZ-96]|nr:nucleotidyltransferase family protein [Qipengyuania pacifica]